MASLVCVSDAPHSSALPYVCVPLCVCVCVCARACFARLPAQMVVHADIQSVSVSFTFCHANESEMDSEIHARVRTLNPLSVSLSLLWQKLVRAAVAIVSVQFHFRVRFTPVCFTLVGAAALRTSYVRRYGYSGCL